MKAGHIYTVAQNNNIDTQHINERRELCLGTFQEQ